MENTPNSGKKFSNAAWDALLERAVGQIKALAASKGAEYSGDEDRLDNFRRGGQRLGLPMEVIWSVYANKHWDALQTYIKDLNRSFERKRSEPIDGRVDDLLVYLLLFKAMLEERARPKYGEVRVTNNPQFIAYPMPTRCIKCGMYLVPGNIHNC